VRPCANARRGNGALNFLWFIMMLASVGLMYYFYLKSERLERELRQLKQMVAKGEVLATTAAPTDLFAEGVPPESGTQETSAPTQAIAETAKPSPTPESAGAEERAHATAPSASVGQESAAESGAKSASEEAASVRATPTSAEEKARPAGEKSSAEKGAAASSTPGEGRGKTATGSGGRPARISSIYDLQRERSGR
jgi:hypothetical protein